ncbi:EAL domain-containing protein [Desulfuromonas acetoxidans]|uniref:Diguanylate cyclase/phosphodiesterase with PAS/PAC sensor(S) n=1 Tax=Desulfuromonas acetoxidans (strain DSM 684 / 11070) TaxID=281689 RepID=Q1K210_DESA6|nr:EAL domain-containing protein [Desulfuromonas acetoxidans]EAT16629.1 diguanylate cyclase/phosphodiesterase with PAS/PAC sensor(s) [Desulfuromonas acetoxidans DSM 684]MBF0644405.1 EAL domain-containing protein [Desulfuromonas acetoxidans]NVD24741.1 EAL domain-containing protein [Desulfuromonas acetoxidans]NVE16786.1 EAL domain-containing protein [Desulfuromonas acetoxidans]
MASPADHHDTAHHQQSNGKLILLLVFFCLTMLVCLSAAIFYDYQKKTISEAAQVNLTMLTNLKARQVGHWRHERIIHAQLLTANRDLLDSIALFIDQRTPDRANHIIQSLTPALSDSEDHAIVLTDASGLPILSVGDNINLKAHIDPEPLVTALDRHEVMFSKLFHVHSNATIHHHGHSHADVRTTHVHMNLIAPLYRHGDPAQEILGALIFIINPEHFLVPLMSSWPVPSPSAESVLVRKVDNKVLRLTPTRHAVSHEMLVSVKPPEGYETPGSRITEEKEGVFLGYDYRRVPVLASIKKVENSPWYLVAKIDKKEVMAPLFRIATIEAVTAIMFLAAASIMMMLWWRRQQALYQASYYQQQLQHQMLSQRFDNLTRFANDLVLLVDAQGQIIDANERALDTYGYPEDELKTFKLKDLCDLSQQECDLFWEQLKVEQGVRFETMQFRQDGSTFPVEINARWIDLDRGHLVQAIIRDISERKAAEDQLVHQAYHDPLTGLPNRLLISDRLKLAIAKARRHKTQAVLLLLDLDRFKNINDTLGHAVGDRILTTLAQRMQETLRDTDTVARFGGDEFLVLLEDIRELSDVVSLAQKLSDLVSQPVLIDGEEMCLTTSVGISVAPEDSIEVDQLIRFADTAMYRAKEKGRNNFQFYTPDMNAHAGRRLQLENNLRKALQRQEMVVYYQPQVEMDSGRIIGSEALLRWMHPEHGLISPNDFIPLAEETGVIEEIGAWALEQACQQTVAWQKNHPELKIAVNLSARQFRNENLVDDIEQILNKTGLAARHLEMELTESLLMEDVDVAIDLMNRLTKLGITLAIDDFGTGYSSLSHLNRFPIDKLKIDRSFVNSMSLDNNGIARTIITLGRTLGLSIIAEGVENNEQRQLLLQLGCPQAQGYYFSRPVHDNAFSEMLEKPTILPNS